MVVGDWCLTASVMAVFHLAMSVSRPNYSINGTCPSLSFMSPTREVRLFGKIFSVVFWRRVKMRS